MGLIKKRSKISGIGVFTDSNIVSGGSFYNIPLGEIDFENKKRWACIGNGRHVCDKNVLNYVNHSCSPNCELVLEEKPFLRSLTSIASGEEITVDYRKTEVDKLKFKCNCKSDKCFSKKVLLISMCKEKMHELEFVRPVEDILKAYSVEFFVRSYKRIAKKDLNVASKIIICGTSLKDNEFIKNVKRFEWIKNIKKPVLGICAGMQIIGMVFGGQVEKKREIGFYKENFKEEFLGLSGEQEVYHLHNNYIDFGKLKEFKVVSENEISQAIKYTEKEIYGALFHPEVRQKDMIMEFVKI